MGWLDVVLKVLQVILIPLGVGIFFLWRSMHARLVVLEAWKIAYDAKHEEQASEAKRRWERDQAASTEVLRQLVQQQHHLVGEMQQQSSELFRLTPTSLPASRLTPKP